MKRGQALGGLVVALALAGAGVGLAFATPAHALEPTAAADDTTTTPEPNPDPAPAPGPAPKPKPVAKPKPAPVHHSTPAYTPPVHTTPTRSYTPSYTAPTHVAPAQPKHVVTHTKQKRHVAAKPKPAPVVQTTPAPVPQLNVGSPTAALTGATAGSNSLRHALVIAGIGVAALLFLLVVAVPATAARFTAPGRAVIDHQTDLVVAGVATLLLTVLLFAVTSGG